MLPILKTKSRERKKKDEKRAKIGIEYVGRAGQCPSEMATAGSRTRGESHAEEKVNHERNRSP